MNAEILTLLVSFIDGNEIRQMFNGEEEITKQFQEFLSGIFGEEITSTEMIYEEGTTTRPAIFLNESPNDAVYTVVLLNGEANKPTGLLIFDLKDGKFEGLALLNEDQNSLEAKCDPVDLKNRKNKLQQFISENLRNFGIYPIVLEVNESKVLEVPNWSSNKAKNTRTFMYFVDQE